MLDTVAGGRIARLPKPDAEAENAEIGAAVSEIVELMHGSAGILAIQSKSSSRLIPVHAGAAIGHDRVEQMLEAIGRVAVELPEGKAQWHSWPDGPATILLISVPPVVGHGRLVILIVFERLSPNVKRLAEDVYARRRPFAVGFFRLWQINRKLSQQSQALEAVLDCTETGVVLIDMTARVRFANGAARTILAKENGLACMQGTLRPTSLADGVNFQAALSHLCFPRSGSAEICAPESKTAPLLTFRRKDAPPLIAMLLPAHVPPLEPDDVAAIVHIIDPVFDAEKMLSPLCRLYGLSRVETSLVCRLASGEALSEAADVLHIREQTARSYLKQIFIKTGTKRQAELIVLMLSSLMRIRHDILQEAMTPIHTRDGSARFA